MLTFDLWLLISMVGHLVNVSMVSWPAGAACSCSFSAPLRLRPAPLRPCAVGRRGRQLLAGGRYIVVVGPGADAPLPAATRRAADAVSGRLDAMVAAAGIHRRCPPQESLTRPRL